MNKCLALSSHAGKLLDRCPVYRLWPAEVLYLILFGIGIKTEVALTRRSANTILLDHHAIDNRNIIADFQANLLDANNLR